jgi:hypothetical protein
MDGYLRKPIRIPQSLAAIPPALAVREQRKTSSTAAVGDQHGNSDLTRNANFRLWPE